MSIVHVIANQTRLAIPSDGKGGVCTLRGASTAANTTYSTTTVDGLIVPTVTDANATPFNATYQGHPAGAFANIAAGDLIVTADGYYGTVASKTAPGTVTLREPWRHMTNVAQDGRIPAAAGACAVFSPSILAGCRSPKNYIRHAVILLAAAATYQVLTAGGAVILPAQTVAAGKPTPDHVTLGGDTGVQFRGPFGVLCSATTIQLELVFDLNG